MRHLKIIIPIVLLLTITISLYIGSHVIAQVKSDCQTDTPISTIPSNPTNPLPPPCNCSGIVPTIVASSGTVSPGGSITL